MKKYLSIAAALIGISAVAVAGAQSAGASSYEPPPCEQETITVVDSPEQVVFHPEGTHLVYHPAETHVVQHAAETHVVQHAAETHVVHHDAVTETGPGQRFQYKPAGDPVGSSTPVSDPGSWQASNAQYKGESLGVVYQKGNGNGSFFYWGTATIIVEEAYDQVVIDKPAYDETVVDKPAYDEVVIDKPAYDEVVVDEQAWYETIPAVTHEEPNPDFPCEDETEKPTEETPTKENPVDELDESDNDAGDKNVASKQDKKNDDPRQVVPVAVNSQQSGNLPHTS